MPDQHLVVNCSGQRRVVVLRGHGGSVDQSWKNQIYLPFAHAALLGTRGASLIKSPPLMPKHVWAIRVRLEISENHRDLALFNLAIDSKLRGCDLVNLKVADVYAAGQIKEAPQSLRAKPRNPSSSRSPRARENRFCAGWKNR